MNRSSSEQFYKCQTTENHQAYKNQKKLLQQTLQKGKKEILYKSKFENDNR